MEENKRFMDIVSKMSLFTKPSLAGIYGVKTPDSGELVGSGLFINLRGEPYILTASHVALRYKDFIGLAHSRPDNLSPSFFTYPYNLFTNLADLCLVKVDPNQLIGPNTNIKPIESSKLKDDITGIEDDILFIHGFPGKRSRESVWANGLVSDTLHYGSITGKSSYKWFNKNYHFAIAYPIDNLIDERQRDVSFVEPYGLSGSAVWKTNQNLYGNSWKPDYSQVVGVIHTWDQDAQSLIGTRIEVVREFLIHCLRCEFAYYRWKDRGEPISDDWNDWFQACDEIHEI